MYNFLELTTKKNEHVLVDIKTIKMIVSDKMGFGIVILKDDFEIYTNELYEHLKVIVFDFTSNL